MNKRITMGLLIILGMAVNTMNAQEKNSQLSHPKEIVEELLTGAESSNSDAFIIEQDGKPIAEYYGSEKRLIETMSVTKLIVSLGVGRLLADEKVDSLDQPVHAFYPEWKQGSKQEITLRHLLSHTSGLQNVPNATVEIYPSPDVVQLALAAELEHEPGTQLSYNNKAVNLLAGIFEQASGQQMDVYIERELFRPMGIEEYQWVTDYAGNPYAMSGLQLNAKDLAKFGRLILNGGMWQGRKFITARYLDEMLGKNSNGEFGLLWRKLYKSVHFTLADDDIQRFKENGVSVEYIQKLEPYLDTVIDRSEIENVYMEIFGTPDVLHREFTERGVETIFTSKTGEVAGYYGDGDLGQYLVVLPDADIVMVRQIERSSTYNPRTDGFREILQLAPKLLPRH